MPDGFFWRKFNFFVAHQTVDVRNGIAFAVGTFDDSFFKIINFNEVELGEYCRRKGLYPEQIAGWKNGFALGSSAPINKAEREQLREQAATIKQLEKELNRKDKALAETAALLILQKKFQALWEEPEAEKSTSRRAKN